jgi:cytochrome c oxidase subunit II
MAPTVRRLLALASVLLLLAAVAALATSPEALADGGFTPVEPASPNADGIKDAFLFVSIFILAIFLLVQCTLVLFIWRYRRRRRPRFEDGAQVHGATNLELIWTGAPVVVLFLIGGFVFYELPGIAAVPEAGASGDRLEVTVSGHQFYWQYEYPNGAIAIDRLRAPAGVPVRLEVTAPDEDVIHSWWIPALGGKIDAIPGVVNETWFEVAEPGVFKGQCAELCGVQHAGMLATVEVLPEDEFDAWLEERGTTQAASSELGEEHWQGVCAKCHGLSGEGGIAPRIAGSPVLADREDLEALVSNGRREMPAVGRDWTDDQIDALVAYLGESPPSGQ